MYMFLHLANHFSMHYLTLISLMFLLSVAGHSAAFLDSIAFEPLFDLLEINNELYIYVPELREVRVSIYQ